MTKTQAQWLGVGEVLKHTLTGELGMVVRSFGQRGMVSVDWTTGKNSILPIGLVDRVDA